MKKLEQFLIKHGCFDTKHSGESLGSHLMNTCFLLECTDAPERVCLAGGLHSIYGTNAFPKATLEARADVMDAFGREVERLVYIFGRIERPRSLEEINDQGGIVIDRKTGDEICLSEQDVHDLRLLEAANLLEQGNDLSGWPKICAVMENSVVKEDAA